MTDKHLNKNTSLNAHASGNSGCFNFDKYFPGITAFQTKELSLFAFVLKWLPL